MEQAVHAEHSNDGAVKEIWRVTIILSILTAVELALGFYMMKLTSHQFILAMQ